MGSAQLISRIRLGNAEPVRQQQGLIHLLQVQLTPLGRHGEGAVVQITPEVAEGIADAAPVIWSELWVVQRHGWLLDRARMSCMQNVLSFA